MLSILHLLLVVIPTTGLGVTGRVKVNSTCSVTAQPIKKVASMYHTSSSVHSWTVSGPREQSQGGLVHE
jgi:hypothetical protein